MKYVNIITGASIETGAAFSGANWRPVVKQAAEKPDAAPEPEVVPEENPKKNRKSKK